MKNKIFFTICAADSPVADAGAAGAPGLDLLVAAHQPGEVAGGPVLRCLLSGHQGVQVGANNTEDSANAGSGG